MVIKVQIDTFVWGDAVFYMFCHQVGFKEKWLCLIALVTIVILYSHFVV